MRYPVLVALTALPLVTHVAPVRRPAVAYPRLLMFYGGPLKERHVITDHYEVIQLLEDLGSPAAVDSTVQASDRQVAQFGPLIVRQKIRSNDDRPCCRGSGARPDVRIGLQAVDCGCDSNFTVFASRDLGRCAKNLWRNADDGNANHQSSVWPYSDQCECMVAGQSVDCV